MSCENLLITQLPRDLTDVDLMKIFEKYHPKSAKMMLDTSSGKSKGFGFVLFPSRESGFQAYQEMNQKIVDYEEKTFPLVIYPSKHDGNIANEPNRALFIRNIPISVPQEEVLDFLVQFGRVTKYTLRSVKQKNSMVWAVFAEYSTIEEAKNALSLIHGSMKYFGTDIALLAKFADTEDAKKARRLRREQEKKASLENTRIMTNATQMITETQGAFNGTGCPGIPDSNQAVFSMANVSFPANPQNGVVLPSIFPNLVSSVNEHGYFWSQTPGRQPAASFPPVAASGIPFMTQASGFVHLGAVPIQGSFPCIQSQLVYAPTPNAGTPGLPAFSPYSAPFIHIMPTASSLAPRSVPTPIDSFNGNFGT